MGCSVPGHTGHAAQWESLVEHSTSGSTQTPSLLPPPLICLPAFWLKVHLP